MDIQTAVTKIESGIENRTLLTLWKTIHCDKSRNSKLASSTFMTTLVTLRVAAVKAVISEVEVEVASWALSINQPVPLMLGFFRTRINERMPLYASLVKRDPLDPIISGGKSA